MTNALFQNAVDHHRAGRLKQAEEAYRTILASEPANVDALHGLGLIAFQVGQPAEAVRLISAAVDQRPDSMAFLSNYGMALQANRQFQQAEAAFHRAIQLAPETAGLYFNLANCLKAQGRFTDAIPVYQQAIARQPSHAPAHMNLGNTYHELGRLDFASKALVRSIELNPAAPEAYMNLANVLSSLGQPHEAEAYCRHAIQLQPTLGAAHINLGNALRSLGRKPEAAECYKRALELLPNSSEAHENLAIILLDLKQLDAAIKLFKRSAELSPERPEAWSHLANTSMLRRKFNEGDACYRKAIALDPRDSSHWSSWLCWQLYRPENNLPAVLARHKEWADAMTKQTGGDSETSSNTPIHRAPIVGRKMRVGFVSADLGHHPIGFFTIRTLEALHKADFELFFYSTLNRGNNEINSRFRACATQWRDVKHLLDQDLVDLIRGDQIDVLIDLTGHTAGNRFAIFAQRIAPVQATWIASEGTTGLASMDYLIADERLVPISAEPFYSEQIVRLPTSYVSWYPPAGAPAVTPLPALSTKTITFGSFNNPAKYHDAVIALWSRIMNSVPGSRMLLQYKHLSDPVLQARLLELFSEHGVSPDRIEFRDWQPYEEFLGNYGEVDIALDPFPFAGGATTCEALWMGVPVVTLPGETYTSRHSCSYLHTIGLDELIAENDQAYVDIAIGLANDLPRLRQLRDTLRSRMAESPLCDGASCAQELAVALRQMWAGEF